MNRKLQLLAIASLTAVVLTGCGGGGGGGYGFPPPVATTPPPAANDPYDDFVAYVKALIATALDTAEPADVAAFDPPPTSETKDPIVTE